MPTPRPRWLLKEGTQDRIFSIEIGGKNVYEMVEEADKALTEGIKIIDTANDGAQWAFDTMSTWYRENVVGKEVPFTNVVDAVDKFLTDTYKMGLYVYATRPDYGGYDYLSGAIAESFEREDDLMRPRFSENASMGGLVLLLSGSLVEVLVTTMVISYLRGNPPDFGEMAEMVLDRVFAYKYFWNTVTEMAAETGQDANELVTNTLNRFRSSVLGKAAKNLIEDLMPKDFPVEEVKLKYQEEVRLIDKIDVEKRVKVRFNVHDVPFGKVSPLTFDDVATVRQGFIAAYRPEGGQAVIDAYDRETGKIVKRFAITVEQSYDPLAEMDNLVMLDTDHLFDHWQQIFKPAGLIPGATRFVQNAHQVLEDTGAIIASKAEIDNMVLSAIDETADAVDRLAGRADFLAKEVQGQLRSALYDLTNLVKVGVLYVPPSIGGTHQFLYALDQFLSNEAEGAPFLQQGEFCAAIVIAAGLPIDVNNPAATPVVNALKDAANVFPGVNIE